MKIQMEWQEYPSGETCPSCENEIVLIVGAGPGELHLECDCGRSVALGSGAPTLPHAA